MEFKHTSVLFDECMEGLNIRPDGIYVDGTLGGGGHSEGICRRLGEHGLLIGIDRDKQKSRYTKAAEKVIDHSRHYLFRCLCNGFCLMNFYVRLENFFLSSHKYPDMRNANYSSKQKIFCKKICLCRPKSAEAVVICFRL